MLLVPAVVGFQEPAEGEVAREPSLLQSVVVRASRGRRVGKLEQQGRNLGAGEVAVLQRPRDDGEPLALAADVERDSVELRKRTADFAFVVRRGRSGKTAIEKVVEESSTRLLCKSASSAVKLGRAARNQFMPASHSFSVILEPQPDGGFTVLVPALPEVVTEGDTEGDALASAQEAIRAVLEYRIAHGLEIPPDAFLEIRRVTVAA